MSELLPIWSAKDLEGATLPSSFPIPNNVNARTLKINNQSRFWLILVKTSTSVQVDRIEPFSYLIFPFESDLSLQIDTSGDAAPTSSLSPDMQFVDYSTISGVITYSKGSTQFSGGTSVTINGGVSIANSSLNVSIVGTPTFNLAAGTQVDITGGNIQIINEIANPVPHVQSLYDPNTGQYLQDYGVPYEFNLVPLNSYNSTTQDRQFNPPSGLKTSQGIMMVVNVTAISGTPTTGILPQIWWDTKSGGSFPVASPQNYITQTGYYRFIWHPTVPEQVSATEHGHIQETHPFFLPYSWHYQTYYGDNCTYTFYVDACLLP